jgi:6-phosphogluconate dehydrogenase
MVEDIRRALLAARIVAYAEGFLLLRRASAEYGWPLDPRKVALVWREGCNIRSGFLDDIAEAYRKDAALPSLILDSHFKALLDQCLPSLRKVTVRAIEQGLPVPGFTSALAFYDGYRATWLPANLVQALRDRFGAHGYERVDRPRGENFHSEWK